MTCTRCKHRVEITRLQERQARLREEQARLDEELAQLVEEEARQTQEEARLLQEESRLRETCSKCTLGESVAGDGSISLDHIHDGTADKILKIAPGYSTTYTFDPGEIGEPPQEPDPETKTRETLQTLLACVAELPYEHVSRLAKIADVFKDLSPLQFEIVAHLLNGGTAIGYARAHGLTKQTAFARIKTLFKTHPIFKAIANGKLLHGTGGRKAAPRDIPAAPNVPQAPCEREGGQPLYAPHPEATGAPQAIHGDPASVVEHTGSSPGGGE